MTLGNMRHLAEHRLVASCLNDACRHQGLIDVSRRGHEIGKFLAPCGVVFC
jgi:hypothetical protein